MNQPNRSYLFEYAGRKFSSADLVRTFKAVGIKPGDKLFVHSDLRSFGKINPRISQKEYLGAFVEALTGLVGKRGTIIMPTFSYSFCRGEIYDPRKTPSTVGSLTEYFRQLPGVARTIDPIFSVAIWGAKQKFFQAVGHDCFGSRSIFQKIRDTKGNFLFLGETFALTYLHFIEQDFGVPYRWLKKFTGQIRLKGGLKKFAFDYNIRPLDGTVNYETEKIAAFLERAAGLKKKPLGYSKVRVVGAREAYRAIVKKLKIDPRFLIKKRARCTN